MNTTRSIAFRWAALASLLLAGLLPAAALGSVARAAATGGTARAQTSVFTFGREGGNIQPFTVSIASDGTVNVQGPVRTLHAPAKLTKDAVDGLIKLAQAEKFFSLPAHITGTGLPDVAGLFIRVSTPSKTKTVHLRHAKNARFSQLFAVLLATAGVAQ